MTTQAWSSRIRHDSDATFREWGSEFSARLLACGMVQTADTGQINWVTVARPGTNTEGGFEIWTFNDTIQATSPIYIRFGYGTGTGTTTPRLQMTVGTGSNGSGTITGTAPYTINNVGPTGAETTDTVRNSYMCHTEGSWGVFWKLGSNTASNIIIPRTCDNAGAPTGLGCLVWKGGQSFLTTASMRLQATATITSKLTSPGSSQNCLDPYVPGSSAVGADFQAYVAFGVFPRVTPVLGLCGVRNSEFSEATTFSVAIVGSTAHTYIAGPSNATHMSSNSSLKPAMLWE